VNKIGFGQCCGRGPPRVESLVHCHRNSVEFGAADGSAGEEEVRPGVAVTGDNIRRADIARCSIRSFVHCHRNLGLLKPPKRPGDNIEQFNVSADSKNMIARSCTR